MKLTALFFIVLLLSSAISISSAHATVPNKMYIQDSDVQTYSFETKHVRYAIPHHITNATLDDIQINCHGISTMIKITPTDDERNGEIELSIHRDMFDFRQNGSRGDFIVLLDEIEIEFQEKRFTDIRHISIPFLPDSKEIEIVASWVPEGSSPDKTCNIIHNPPFSHILPPSKQVRNGSLLQDITCKDDLNLAFKDSVTPSCVKNDSIDKLVERGWIEYYSEMNPELHIVRYSPVLFEGTGTDLSHDEFTPEDLENAKQREKELKALLESSKISHDLKDELRNERQAISHYAQSAFDAGISFELVKVLWEKHGQIMDMMITQGADNVFPITGTSGVSIDNPTYSMDEEYIGNHPAIRIQVMEDYFTRANLEKTDQMIRGHIGNEINLAYEKSGGYITFD